MLIDQSRDKPTATLFISGASEILTCRRDATDNVGRIAFGVVAIVGERILAVGSQTDVNARCDLTGAKRMDACGGIVVPGFVDCHTHLVFAGSRIDEYCARIAGLTTLEIAARRIPVGIRATVTKLLSATDAELIESARERLEHMLRFGTTTVEIKSGYGLSTATELRMLRINHHLKSVQPIDIVSTYLGAHEFPEHKSRAAYIDEIIHEGIPTVAEAGLAEFNDVYCDDGYYTVAESRRILEAGLKHGLKPKIHTDAYSHIGGSMLAAELPTVSADHLNYTDKSEMGALRAAGVVGVVMPGLDFAVGHPKPFSGRQMLDAGLELALATDMCPGCWLESMPYVIQLACRLYKFSPAEALRAATLLAAKALNREHDLGSIEPGKRADLAIFDLPRYEDLAYRLARGHARTVIKSGNVVYSDQAGKA